MPTAHARSTSAKEHLHELDLLRGLACAMVVCFHFLYRGQLANWLTDPAPAALAALSRFGGLGVHLFFIISGYVIFMSAQGASLRAFAASRAARLYPAMWVAAPLTAFTAWWLHSDTFGVTPGVLLANLTMVPQWFRIDWVDGSYWSLAVELQFYLLIAAAIATGLLEHIEKLSFGWLALTVVDQIRPTYPLEFWLAVQWAPYFCIGIVCHRIRQHGLDASRGLLLGVSWLLAMTGWAVKAKGGTPLQADTLVPVVAVTAFFVVFLGIALRRWRCPATRFGALAGALTYPVYLVHQNFGYLLIEALKPTDWPFLGRVLLVVGIIVAVAWGIHRWVERPLGRGLRRWLAPKPASRADAQVA